MKDAKDFFEPPRHLDRWLKAILIGQGNGK